MHSLLYALCNSMIFWISEAQAIACDIGLACNFVGYTKCRRNTGKGKFHSLFIAELSPENLFQSFFILDYLLASILATYSFSIFTPT